MYRETSSRNQQESRSGFGFAGGFARGLACLGVYVEEIAPDFEALGFAAYRQECFL
jgi:hypothetical protein